VLQHITTSNYSSGHTAVPWNFGTQAKSIPIPVFSHILSARTTHRKHSHYIVAWSRPPRKLVSSIRLRVDWSICSTGLSAEDRKHCLICCCVLDRVYRAVALQRVDQIRYNVIHQQHSGSDRTDWSLDLYSRSARFVYRPEHLLSWMRVFVVFFGPSRYLQM
jgi:hypothetical protein